MDTLASVKDCKTKFPLFMNNKRSFLTLLLVSFLSWNLLAQEKPAMTWKDIPSWHYIRTNNSVISPDGNWLSWPSGPTKGDLNLTIRHVNDALKYDFPIGATTTSAVFSESGNYVAFRESPKDAEVETAKKTKRPLYTKLQVVSLTDTQKVSFDRIRSFAFSGEQANWIAVSLAAAENVSRGPNAPKGTDLLLYNLDDKTTFNIGNVSQYVFNKAGTLLAYIIDAQEQNGNGILIRDMKSGITTALDNDKATYSGINWNDDGTAFALLKANRNDNYKSEVYGVLGFQKINGNQTEKTFYSGIEDPNFPEGKGISQHGRAFWSDDLSTLFFGIAGLEKKDVKTPKSAADGDSTATNKPSKQADLEKPDMIIWNWQDTRLQSAQQVQLTRDKNANLQSAYRTKSNQFVQLADEDMRMVTLAPQQQYALGYDYTPYEMDNNLSGQNFVDVYLIDVLTGAKALLLEKHYQNASRTMAVAPNGKFVAYYKDGVYYSIDFTNKVHHPLTTGISSSFINNMIDNNVDKPATPILGWSEDSKFVLIRDNFDLWKIAADGKNVQALTSNWKNDQLKVNGAYRIYPDDKGIDLKKNQYFSLFNEASKQSGIAILEAGKNSLRTLFIDDHSYGGFRKAKNTNSFVYTKENSTDAPELFHTRSTELANASQLTENAPDQDKYAWSAGVRLIEFVSERGDTLQAALYLPANYEEGKSYPTVTYIYERLTQGLNGYANPSFPGGGFNRSIYTSNGYAVLMPDIKYELNEPGTSAVACVVPAVKAAIASGIVDGDNVAIHGHSWGGYQTSFLITQTNIFKAAAAGAPLTNMISMYSLIYWNSGSTNQSIFESSQGRLTTGYWDNWDAYKRNSPIFYIKDVQTPLLMLHNDKDGAVDYTQGIEYYNGLRRLNKPVAMMTYKGENHGIVKEVNKKDYAVRMLEFMDHYLKGAPAPDWWEKGVDLLNLEKHLEERAF